MKFLLCYKFSVYEKRKINYQLINHHAKKWLFADLFNEFRYSDRNSYKRHIYTNIIISYNSKRNSFSISANMTSANHVKMFWFNEQNLNMSFHCAKVKKLICNLKIRIFVDRKQVVYI